ncbi:MAG: hypothetical protein LBF12_06960 [Christensenellaceae bacterium]|jgi:hypothetical protein|nr:hypothetical protein [Christensenellaceae bacterium]
MSADKTEKNVLLEKLATTFGVGKPFFISEVYETWPDYSQLAASNLLFSLLDENLVKRYDSQTFYIPKTLPSGETINLDPYSILERRYVTDGKNIYGYFLGEQLLYLVGIIKTQPTKLIIVSDRIQSRTRPVSFEKYLCTVHRSKHKTTQDLANAHMVLSILDQYDGPLTPEIKEKMTELFKGLDLKIAELEKFLTRFPTSTHQRLLDSGLSIELQ